MIRRIPGRKEGATDSLTLGVIWDGLISTCYEMGATVHATAYSDVVREGHDYCTAIFDRRGRMVAAADFAPGLLGATPGVMTHFLREYKSEEIQPGDTLILNDPYMGSGHMPDLFMCSPVHLDSTLVGFTVTCVHHADVGGAVPGSQVVVGVRDRFAEGLCLPPVRLVHQGRQNQEILRLIAHNVRLPDLVLGDLRAQLSANHAGGRRLAEIVSRHGIATYEDAVDTILDWSELATREGIASIPAGSYTYNGWMDDFGPHTLPIKIVVQIEVRNSSVQVDFAGSSPQTPSGMNAPLNFTKGIVYYAVKAMTDTAAVPQNAGCLRPISVSAPPGNFFNPTAPSPSSARAAIAARIFEACMGALRQARPDRGTAENSYPVTQSITGIDSAGRRFVWWELLVGGVGAQPRADGQEGLPVPFNMTNIPVEVVESRFPVMVERLELIQDSGGAGRYRGGLGLRKDFRILAESIRVTSMTDRQVFAAAGIAMGKAGSLGRILRIRAGHSRRLHSKGTYDLRRGDVLRLETAGAGGYGDAWSRDPELVRIDFEADRLSLRSAQRDYGVVLERRGRVNYPKTKALRNHRNEQQSAG